LLVFNVFLSFALRRFFYSEKYSMRQKKSKPKREDSFFRIHSKKSQQERKDCTLTFPETAVIL